MPEQVKIYTSKVPRALHLLPIVYHLFRSWKNPDLSENYLKEKIQSHAAHLRGPIAKGLQLLADAHGVVPDNVRRACSFSWSDMPPAMSSNEMESYLREELEDSKKSRLESIFAEIDFDHPMSASFATVLKAKLRNKERSPVAIKILYKGIEKVIEGDINTLRRISKSGRVLGLAPKYAPRVLAEIRDRCKEEADLRNEAQNMLDSFNWYCELFSGVDKLDDFSHIKRALKKSITSPKSRQNDPFVSVEASMKLMRDYHFIHPVPYLGEFGRNNLCTKNVLVMDFIPGIEGSKIKAADEEFDPEIEFLREHLAQRTEALGLISMHPHKILKGQDDKKYAVHSDIHPGNVIIHCSPDPRIGICTGIVDFGNVQRLDYKHSRKMYEVMERAIELGRNGFSSSISANQLAEAYVAAGVVDSIDNPALIKILIPFVLQTTAPYHHAGGFDYSNRKHFTDLNRLMWNTLFSPTIQPTGDEFWMQRAMYLHANAMHRIGEEVDAYTPYEEIRKLK